MTAESAGPVDPWADFDLSTADHHETGPSQRLRLAFYGRCSTEDAQDPKTSHDWQLLAARNLLRTAAPDGEIVADFFDIGQSRVLPWKRRREASRLMRALDQPSRPFDGIIVGEGQRCWFGSQFSEVAPVLEHHGVSLWVPELGGCYDPRNSTHYMLMTLTGGMSRGERQRVQERVRLGMAVQVENDGRYQGGRPPYGYTVVGYAPHPNPRKAAEGFQLKKLVPDPERAAVVERIFADLLAGRSLRAIVAALNEEQVPCPSAADPARNAHRDMTGWQVPTLRAILTNPRYTGYEVWGTFKKTETLIDPEDPTWGYRTRLVRSDAKPVRSREQTHEAIVDVVTFTRANKVLSARGAVSQVSKSRRNRTRGTSHALQGLVYCSICGRRMQVHRSDVSSAEPSGPRYRCRLRDLTPGSAAAERHPRSVSVGQELMLGKVRTWMVELFDGDLRDEAMAGLLAAAAAPRLVDVQTERLHERVAAAETKLRRFGQAIALGTNPAALVGPMNEAQEELAAAQIELSLITAPARAPSRERLQRLFDDIGGQVRHLLAPQRSPELLREFFVETGLRLTWDHPDRLLHAELDLSESLSSDLRETGEIRGVKGRVRGGT